MPVSASRPRNLTASWPLGLSHSVTVRPIQAEDIDLEAEFVRGLSQQTRYNRFLGAGVKLTRKLLEKFTRIDFSRDMALIATTTVEGSELAIGVARYARLEDGVSCEFAITIADAWQCRGIGRRLLTMLIASARQHGATRLVGEVFASNTPMLQLAQSLAFRVGLHPEGGPLRRVTLDLESRPA
jgi:acetyltransferase